MNSATANSDPFMGTSDSYFQLTHTSEAGINIFVHPDYYNSAKSDRVSVCLIKTEENFMQMAADNGQELLMPFMMESYPQEGKACWTAGWGSDDKNLETPTGQWNEYGQFNDNNNNNNEHLYLNVAGVNLIGHETCKNYAHSGITDNMNQYDICAGSPENDGTEFINQNVAGTLSYIITESLFIKMKKI